MSRATFLSTTERVLLDDWVCNLQGSLTELGDIFGTYLVGSALTKQNYRDVDVRMIVGDEVSDVDLFKWSRLNMLVSMWGQQVTGLPIDFQMQTQVEAQMFRGLRNALGVGAAVKGEKNE